MEIVFDDDSDGCKSAAKKASEGSFVMKDAVLMEFKRVDGTIGKIKTATEGVVVFTKGMKRGDVLEKGQVIATVSDCTHAIVIKDMCATCGRDLREKGGRAGQRKEQSTANIAMIHHVPELIVSDTLAKELGSADESNLIATRKLVLLVDLDQTIIHTSNQPISQEVTQKHTDIAKYNIHGGVYSTKLRPHTTEFLNKMSKLYEMHIVTYGQRQYAHKIAHILDPDAKLFAQRILSRDELFSAQHKTRNLKALFPCGDNLVVIIDDRSDVWMYSEALIQIKPYRFFKEVGDINAPKNSKEQMPVEIEDDAHEDRVLEEIERVLTNIHDKYYELHDLKDPGKPLLDVKDIIKQQRKKVLDGVVVVFSGIVPVGEKLERTDIYRLVVQFGGKVVENVTDEVTHIVAARYGTQKIHQGVRTGKHLVTVQWVYACVEKWIKADEKLFELTKETTPPTGRPLGSKYVNNMANSSTIGKSTLASMNDEVDEALSDEDEDEDDEKDDEDGDDLDSEEKEDGNEEDEGEKEGNDTAEEVLLPKEEGNKKVEEKVEVEKKNENRKRKHAPEEEYESDSEVEEDDDDPPTSYKQLLSRSKKQGRLAQEDVDEDSIFDVDDEKGHVPPTHENEDDDLDDEEIPEEDDDEDYEDMAAMIERQVSHDG